jgi:cytochrome bd ubiquinol oxidase subunit I
VDGERQGAIQFWTKIFAVSFAVGVVSGIVLSYQFGTNWSRFSVVVGNVIGPLIGYEVLVAFFLEATFLGIMLFGWKRVSPWLHTLSAVAVAAGTLMSAFFILSANSWMQTPAGYVMRDGIAYPTDWLAVIFNPSFPYRLAHMVAAAYLTTCFVVLAVGARSSTSGWRTARSPAAHSIGRPRSPCCAAWDCWRDMGCLGPPG